jgi:hypothetical protein
LSRRTSGHVKALEVQDFLDIFGHEQQELALTSAAAQTAPLADGIYDLWIDSGRTYLRIAEDASGVTVLNGYPLFAGNVVTFYVRKDHRIGAILSTGSNTLRYHKTYG